MTIEEAFRQLEIVQDFIPAGSSNRPGTRLRPTHITIHNTDNNNRGANAAAHARYVKGPDARRRQVSWHYTVDDRKVYQHLPVNEVGWHAGSGNSKSIGIEICMNSDLDVTRAYDRAALLVAVLALQNAIAVPGKIVQHHHWTGKNCPSVLRSSGWTEFLTKVSDRLNGLRTESLQLEMAVADIVAAQPDDRSDSCERFSIAAPRGAARRSHRPTGRKRARKSKSKSKSQRDRSSVSKVKSATKKTKARRSA